MKYKLIAADLDGTLMGEDAIISPRVKDAVRRAMEKVKFTIATGRTFGSTLLFAEELGVNAPLICYQGGLIKDHLSGQVIYEQSVPLPLAREVIRFTRQKGLHLNVYVEDGRAYVERMTPEARYYTAIAKAPVYPVGDMLAFLDRDPMKLIIILSDDRGTRSLIAELGALFAGRVRFVQSYPQFVEGIPLGVSKGHALARLVAHLGLSLEETIGIGDNDNDLELVERAGLGVAMGNASPTVKAIADYIAPSVDEEGVVKALERFVLS